MWNEHRNWHSTFWSQWCCSHMGHHKPAPLKGIERRFFILDDLHALLLITDVLFRSLYEWAPRSCDPHDNQILLAARETNQMNHWSELYFLNFLFTRWNLSWWRSFQENRNKIARSIEIVELRLLARAWKFRRCGENVELFFWIAYSSNTKLGLVANNECSEDNVQIWQ